MNRMKVLIAKRKLLKWYSNILSTGHVGLSFAKYSFDEFMRRSPPKLFLDEKIIDFYILAAIMKVRNTNRLG